jgi:hypothetical protein
MDEPVTWTQIAGAISFGTFMFLVIVAIYGLGKSRGWWDRGNGPGVE